MNKVLKSDISAANKPRIKKKYMIYNLHFMLNHIVKQYTTHNIDALHCLIEE